MALVTLQVGKCGLTSHKRHQENEADTRHGVCCNDFKAGAVWAVKVKGPLAWAVTPGTSLGLRNAWPWCWVPRVCESPRWGLGGAPSCRSHRHVQLVVLVLTILVKVRLRIFRVQLQKRARGWERQGDRQTFLLFLTSSSQHLFSLQDPSLKYFPASNLHFQITQNAQMD